MDNIFFMQVLLKHLLVKTLAWNRHNHDVSFLLFLRNCNQGYFGSCGIFTVYILGVSEANLRKNGIV